MDFKVTLEFKLTNKKGMVGNVSISFIFIFDIEAELSQSLNGARKPEYPGKTPPNSKSLVE